ncbi:hypothetical protein D3C59_36550 [Streptomyces sp. SHP22-7]|nr:hypothetical protein D3C59_36550 [Streptomyces sp. SHP22-7]
MVAHLLTVATVVFNAAAAEGGVTGDPLGTAMHGVIPLLFIVAVEPPAGRSSRRLTPVTVRRAPRPLAAVSGPYSGPVATYEAVGTGSYQETVQIEQERTVYEAMLQRKYGRGWRRRPRPTSCCP